MRPLFLALLLASASIHAELELDPPGRPNEDGHSINAKLGRDDFPIEHRFAYFAHYSPTVRSTAAASLRKEGAKAMPFLIRGLQSRDRRVVRTSCDTISAVRAYVGVKVNTQSPITAEVAAEAIPDLVALLDRDDDYIQAGALQALSRCGKAAAPHLAQIAPYLTDKEWWLRVSAAYVMQGVGSPETDPYAVDLARALLSEQHVMCLNQMTAALRSIAASSTNIVATVSIIGEGLADMEINTFRRQGLSVLEGLGDRATAARPHIQALVDEGQKAFKETEPSSPMHRELREDLKNLEQALTTIPAE
jgi:HEAT repeat protein